MDVCKKTTKGKKITEDDERRVLEETQKLTDAEIKRMAQMTKAKRKRGNVHITQALLFLIRHFPC